MASEAASFGIFSAHFLLWCAYVYPVCKLQCEFAWKRPKLMVEWSLDRQSVLRNVSLLWVCFLSPSELFSSELSSSKRSSPSKLFSLVRLLLTALISSDLLDCQMIIYPPHLSSSFILLIWLPREGKNKSYSLRLICLSFFECEFGSCSF